VTLCAQQQRRAAPALLAPRSQPNTNTPPFSCAHTHAQNTHSWWKEYSHRKNDQEDDMVADSLLYDERCHLPRTAPGPRFDEQHVWHAELDGGGGGGGGGGEVAAAAGGGAEAAPNAHA
jgi:hypothetical protein